MTVLCALAMLLVFQNTDDKVRFVPIPAGNQITVGPFQYTVPDGAYYTAEDNVHNLFRQAGSQFIPNARGIFYSTSATWDWTVMVQYIQGPFVLVPRADHESFLNYFSHQNLYTNQVGEETPSTVIPATYDDEEGSFTIGLHYPPHDVEGGDGHQHNYVYIKKVWVSNQGALIFSVRAEKPAFDDDFGVISDILSSVERVDTAADTAPVEGQPAITYLDLLSVKLDLPMPANAEAQPETADETSTRRMIFYSLGLLLVAVVILLMALNLRREKKEQPNE